MLTGTRTKFSEQLCCETLYGLLKQVENKFTRAKSRKKLARARYLWNHGASYNKFSVRTFFRAMYTYRSVCTGDNKVPVTAKYRWHQSCSERPPRSAREGSILNLNLVVANRLRIYLWFEHGFDDTAVHTAVLLIVDKFRTLKYSCTCTCTSIYR